MTERFEQLSTWLTGRLGLPITALTPLAGDASFRRYYRAELPNIHYIVMDAPPVKESCGPFVAIATEFSKAGVHAPQIIAQDLEQGFLLLEDMGNTLLLSALDHTTATPLYRLALQTLIRIQHVKKIAGYTLPAFDRAFMYQEMQLFVDWFLKGMLNINLTPQEQTLIDQTFATIAARIESQPYLCVHRDYHSRNLMLLNTGEIGVLDFQDAVWGPVTYDIISLLKDCYIVWPRDKIVDLVGYYHQLARTAGIIHDQSLTDFLSDFDWMGIQRHLKVIGIFSRLNLRDHKPGYLNDIPIAMNYLLDALSQFDELALFQQWLQKRVIPIYQDVWSLANV